MIRTYHGTVMSRPRGPRVPWLGVAALLGLAGLLAPAARAQGPAAAAGQARAAQMRYTNQSQFKLRVDLPDEDRAKLREVQLYVRSPGNEWACKDTAPPTQTHFNYKATQDGEYAFTIVTVDKAGRAVPSDVTKEPPGFVVVVDTQAPEVSVTGPSSPADQLIRCSVKDLNPDPMSLKLEYQTTDKGWSTLDGLPGQPTAFRCPDRGGWTGQVRVTVGDLAKNVTIREVNLSPALSVHAYPPPPASAPAPALTPAMAPPLAPPSRDVVVMDGRPDPMPVDGTEPPLAGTPPLAAPVMAATPQGKQNGPKLILNQPHVVMEYKIDQVGPSGVGKVEVWITSDEGRSWERLCDDIDRRSPAEFDLPKEGTYGVALVVLNGNLVGDPPPSPGTQPDCWIEVDTTKPSAQILAVRPGGEDHPWSLVVSWTANDKNLGPTPIDLYYSTSREGPWQPMGRGLKNAGNYAWDAPREAGPQFFVRMEVTDRAGNMTRCDMPQAVTLDRSRPTGHVISVSPSNAVISPPRAN